MQAGARDGGGGVRLAALALGFVGIGYAFAAATGDALFLSEVGVRHFGTAFAVSSAGLIFTVLWLGRTADRVPRVPLLVVCSMAVALALLLLAALADVYPWGVAILGVFVPKQGVVVVELAFWVVIAEQFDATTARRWIPFWVTSHGVGIAVGSLGVWCLRPGLATAASFAIGALCFVCAAAVVVLLGRYWGRRVVIARRPSALASSWKVVQHSPLARNLAYAVAAAGVFAPMLYYAVGAAAYAQTGTESELAQLLGGYRGIVQLLVVLAALWSPRLFLRLGVAPALLVAPVVALAAGVALSWSFSFVVICVAYAGVRITDVAVQTPAERLVQNLLAPELRGRLHGVLDGIAKRGGAIIGGLVASAVATTHVGLGIAASLIALIWLIASIRLRRGFGMYAAAEIGRRSFEASSDDDTSDELRLQDPQGAVVYARRGLRTGPTQRRRAIALLETLDSRGHVDIIKELGDAGHDVAGWERVTLWRAAWKRGRATRGSLDLGVPRLMVASDEPPTTPDADEMAWIYHYWLYGERTKPEHGHSRISFTEQLEQLRVANEHAKTIQWLRERRDDGDSVAVTALCVDELCWLSDHGELSDEHYVDVVDQMVRCLRTPLRTAWSLDLLDSLAVSIPRLQAAAQQDARAAVLLDSLAGSLRRIATDNSRSGDERGQSLALSSRVERVDARVLVEYLGDPQPPMRQSATECLRRLGMAAVEPLIVAVRHGTRRQRRQANAVLRDLAVDKRRLRELLRRERGELDRLVARIPALVSLKYELLSRRLRECRRETVDVICTLIDSYVSRRDVAELMTGYRKAAERSTRLRIVAALETVLPNDIVRSVLPVLEQHDAQSDAERAASRLGIGLPSLDTAITEEVERRDPIACGLLGRALSAQGNPRDYRVHIVAAAQHAATSFAFALATPADIVERLHGSPVEESVPKTIETMTLLSELALFHGLTTRQLAAIAAELVWSTYSASEPIVHRGDQSDGLYIVQSGRVQVSLTEGASHVAEFGPGEVFGELALLSGEPRSATVLAIEPTRVGYIGRPVFEALVDEVPAIAMAMCRVLALRLQRSNALLI